MSFSIFNYFVVIFSIAGLFANGLGIYLHKLNFFKKKVIPVVYAFKNRKVFKCWSYPNNCLKNANNNQARNMENTENLL